MKKTENIDAKREEIIITTGSQQALYAMGKIFVNPGDTIITEGPTYVGAISAFNANMANMIPIDMDDNGMMIDKLEEKLAELDKNGVKPKFIYVIPTFQNPAGVTMNLERRKRLLEISEKYDIPIIEDNPYGQLRYNGEPVPSIKSMDKNGNVIYLGTFSKVMSPGLRMGYIVASPEVVGKVNLVKQALDLASDSLSEYIALEYLKRGGAFYPHAEKKNSMRLNFTYSDDDKIVEGIKRLAYVIDEEMELVE